MSNVNISDSSISVRGPQISKTSAKAYIALAAAAEANARAIESIALAMKHNAGESKTVGLIIEAKP
jgi:hypothetical protein